MSAQHDKVFVLNFTVVIGVLVAITLIILTIALVLHTELTFDPRQVDRVEQRIAPVGQVNLDPNASVNTAVESSGEPRSGEEIVNTVCAGCHGTGVLDAPKIGDKAAWARELNHDGGLETLILHAINGEKNMPPRGGDPSLSDDEIKQATIYMLKQSGHSF